MNKTRVAIAAALLVALALPARGQVKLGGYLSLEYIKGQADSDYSRGDVENLLAGFLARGEIERKFGFAVEARALGVSTFDLVQAWAGFLPVQGLHGQGRALPRPLRGLEPRQPAPRDAPHPDAPQPGIPLSRRPGASWDWSSRARSASCPTRPIIGNGLAETDGPVQAQQFSDNNADKAKGGRLGLIIGQTIRAGVSYYTGKYDELNQRDLILEGADLSWVTALWEIHGEYTKGILENPQPFEKGRSEGYSPSGRP